MVRIPTDYSAIFLGDHGDALLWLAFWTLWGDVNPQSVQRLPKCPKSLPQSLVISLPLTLTFQKSPLSLSCDPCNLSGIGLVVEF